ncbi:MAG: DUF692 domain-containing protein [Amphritea sp.]
MNQPSVIAPLMVGVGLRHQHFHDVLIAPSQLDFIEVHSENFFGKGGAALHILDQVRALLPVSLHSIALGLGSETNIPEAYLSSLRQLSHHIDPFLMSDHACFSWGQHHNQVLSIGDLLPIAHNQQNINRMADNINRVQDLLGRALIVENVSAYVTLPGSIMTEAEFLAHLLDKTQGKLLLDINNICVSASNENAVDIQAYVRQYLAQLPQNAVGEYHLAGCTPAAEGQLLIDDHAQPVSETVWECFKLALERFGPAPTLIEWDNNLPQWQVLVNEAQKARQVAKSVLENSSCTSSEANEIAGVE